MDTGFTAIILLFGYWGFSGFVNMHRCKKTGHPNRLWVWSWFPALVGLTLACLIPGDYVSGLINELSDGYLDELENGIWYHPAGPVVLSPFAALGFYLHHRFIYVADTEDSRIDLDGVGQDEIHKVQVLPKILGIAVGLCFLVSIIFLFLLKLFDGKFVVYLFLVIMGLIVAQFVYGLYLLLTRYVQLDQRGLTLHAGLSADTRFKWEDVRQVHVLKGLVTRNLRFWVNGKIPEIKGFPADQSEGYITVTGLLNSEAGLKTLINVTSGKIAKTEKTKLEPPDPRLGALADFLLMYFHFLPVFLTIYYYVKLA